ncbi:MarR family winged helix-turn-helix transcriptional regulator [Cohnella sp.]|uniref:MarR family winged helix-turn-helix transcriptional regulator n=1 Tax=Cohnella sp. TaxID=1883426 RepID=UPI003561E713
MLESRDESVGKWISTLDRYFQMFISRNLRKHAIGPGQLHFLMLLYQKDGVSQNELSQKLFVDKATAARAIQILEDVGYVKRIPCEKDRRKNLVYLTEKAIEIRNEIKNTLHKWTDLLTQNMAQEEKSILILLLKKSTANAVHYINEDVPDESKSRD